MSKEKETFSIAEEINKVRFNIFNISVLVHAKRMEEKQSKAGKKLVRVVQCLLYTLLCQQFVLYEEDTVLWDKQYRPKL